MPEMVGLEATQHIRSLTEVTQPRIIAMTANTIEAGVDDYISKASSQ